MSTKILAAMQERGMTARQLADVARVSLTTVSNWRRTPALRMTSGLRAAIEHLDLDEAEVMDAGLIEARKRLAEAKNEAKKALKKK